MLLWLKETWYPYIAITMDAVPGPPFHSKKLYTRAVTSGTNTVKTNIATGRHRYKIRVLVLGLIVVNICCTSPS